MYRSFSFQYACILNNHVVDLYRRNTRISSEESLRVTRTDITLKKIHFIITAILKLINKIRYHDKPYPIFPVGT